jgi:hypothetical protein
MKDYNFCFSWAIKTSDIIDFIQESNQIKVNNDNYGEIFENLSNYIKIDDVILNTSKHPFLFNFVKGAAFNPEKEFNTIFSEVIKKKDLADSFCEVKEKIHHGFKKFFKEAEKNLNDSLGERFENFNKNLHFIDYQDLINSSLEKFEKYNKDEPNFEELKQRFFEKNLNLICGDKYDIYFQIDLLKPLIASQNSKISEFSTIYVDVIAEMATVLWMPLI